MKSNIGVIKYLHLFLLLKANNEIIIIGIITTSLTQSSTGTKTAVLLN
jgi:hypothetical protein